MWRGFPLLRILYVKAGFEARPLYETLEFVLADPRRTADPDRLEQPYTWGLSQTYPPIGA